MMSPQVVEWYCPRCLVARRAPSEVGTAVGDDPPPRERRPLATSAVGGDAGAGVGSHGCATSAVDTNTKDMEFYADPDDPSLYWFIVCRPDCQLNAVRHASFRLEEEAAAIMWWDFHSVKRAVEELREAWIKYYAYW